MRVIGSDNIAYRLWMGTSKGIRSKMFMKEEDERTKRENINPVYFLSFSVRGQTGISDRW